MPTIIYNNEILLSSPKNPTRLVNQPWLDTNTPQTVWIYGSKRCIPLDDYVYSPNGLVQVKDVYDGLPILGGYVKKPYIFEDDVYEVSIGVTKFRSNGEHPIWLRKITEYKQKLRPNFKPKQQWVTVKEIYDHYTNKKSNNSRWFAFRYNAKQFNFKKISVGLRFAKLLGYLMSDGYFSKEQSVKFTNVNKTILEDVLDIGMSISEEFDVGMKQYQKGNGVDIIFTRQGNFHNGSPLKTKLRELGVINRDTFGQIQILEEEELIEFIKGFFNGDGMLVVSRQPRIHFFTGISKRQAYELQFILWRLGVRGFVTYELKNPKFKGCWEVQISKRKDMLKLINILEDIKYPEKFKAFRIALSRLSDSNDSQENETGEWIPISKIEKIGKMKVCGWETEPSHEIISYNGLKTHNSGKGVFIDFCANKFRQAGFGLNLHINSAEGYENLYYAYTNNCKSKWDGWRDDKTQQLRNLVAELKDKVIPKTTLTELNDILFAINEKKQQQDLGTLNKITSMLGVYNELQNEGLHCYDKETEVLTNHGFKLFKDLDGTELMLSLNPETLDLEYVKPINYINYHYKGDLLHFSNKWFDLMVTDKHQVLVEDKVSINNGLNRWFLTDADKVTKSYRMLKSSKWTGVEKDNIMINDMSISTEVFCKFMGYYLSEGSTTRVKNRRNTWAIRIGQFKQNNLQRIFNDIEKMPVKINRYQNSLVISNTKLGVYLSKFGKSYEKYIPEEIKELSPKYIRMFLDAYCLGDGSIYKPKKYKKGNFKDQKRYFTSSKRMCDDIGELILKVGKSPSFYFIGGKGKLCHFKNGDYIQNVDMWRINENTSIHANLDKNPVKKVAYDDNVYCVELPKFHTLYIRRKNKCIWSGNCNCYKPVPIMWMIPDIGTVEQWEINVYNKVNWTNWDEYNNAYVAGFVDDPLPNEPWIDVRKLRKPNSLLPKKEMIKVSEFVVPMDSGDTEIFRSQFREMVRISRDEHRQLCNTKSCYTTDHYGKLQRYTTLAEAFKYLPELSQKDFAQLHLDKPREEWTIWEKSYHKIVILANEVREFAPSQKLSGDSESAVSKKAFFNFIPTIRHNKAWFYGDLQAPSDLEIGVRIQDDLTIIKRNTEKRLGDTFGDFYKEVEKNYYALLLRYSGEEFIDKVSYEVIEFVKGFHPRIPDIPDNKAYVLYGNGEYKLITTNMQSWHHKSDRDDFADQTGIHYRIKDEILANINTSSESKTKQKKVKKTKGEADEEWILIADLKERQKKKWPQIIEHMRKRDEENGVEDSKWIDETPKNLSNKYGNYKTREFNKDANKSTQKG